MGGQDRAGGGVLFKSVLKGQSATGGKEGLSDGHRAVMAFNEADAEVQKEAPSILLHSVSVLPHIRAAEEDQRVTEGRRRRKGEEHLVTSRGPTSGGLMDPTWNRRRGGGASCRPPHGGRRAPTGAIV